MSKYVFKPYNPLFPVLFQREKERILLHVKEQLRIEHVGSTAVPGLGGKGIIDIAIAAAEKETMIPVLQELGYEFRPRFSTQERLYFVINLPDSEEGVRRYHVHVMSNKSQEWQDFLSFREALRKSPQLMQEYAALKEQAASAADGMGEVYRKRKEPLFAKILNVHAKEESMTGPDPCTIYPMKDYQQLVFLKPFVKASNILVGEYTYFDDVRNGPEKFEEYNVLYNYDFSKVKLIIGKFCAIAAETKFIMTGDHKLDAISTFPFPIFQHGWERAYNIADLPVKGDIVVGNDVWFGYDCLIKGGVKIGDGAIVAARAVVVKDVPPYAIVAGNPAKVVKMRFDDKTIERLCRISWWNWEIEKINRHLSLICHLDVDRLEAAGLES